MSILIVAVTVVGTIGFAGTPLHSGEGVTAAQRYGGPLDPFLYLVESSTVEQLAGTQQLTLRLVRLDGYGNEVASITTKVVVPNADDLLAAIESGRCYFRPLTDDPRESACPLPPGGGEA